MLAKTSLFVFLLLTTALGQIVQQNIDAIVIGAGFAGLAASAELTAKGKSHIIIEARNRIGGRANSLTFAGVKMDEGASFVHYPYDDGNRLHKLIKEFNMPTIDANFRLESSFYEGNRSVFSSRRMKQAQKLFSELSDYILDQGWQLYNDAPLSTIVAKFWKSKGNSVDVDLKDWVNQNLQEEAVDNGADLETMSTWQWYGQHDGWDYWDYAPVDTMYQLALNIFNRKCSPAAIHYSERVLRIDYSGSKIVVTTDKDIYQTNTVFSSLPIGVLKAGSVTFTPPLPSQTTQAINSIGSGVFEKVVVKFASRFWPSGQSIVSLTGRGVDSKYVQAFVVPGSDTTLMFFIGGQRVYDFYSKTKAELMTDIENQLKKYTTGSVVVEDVHLTKWGADPLTLCGYSYAKVGTKSRHFRNLAKVVESGNNRLYIIGEHTHVELYSYAHGAYHSGRDAVIAAF